MLKFSVDFNSALQLTHFPCPTPPKNHFPLIFPNFIIYSLDTFRLYEVTLLTFCLYVCFYPTPKKGKLCKKERICQYCPILSSFLATNYLTHSKYSVVFNEMNKSSDFF